MLIIELFLPTRIDQHINLTDVLQRVTCVSHKRRTYQPTHCKSGIGITLTVHCWVPVFSQLGAEVSCQTSAPLFALEKLGYHCFRFRWEFLFGRRRAECELTSIPLLRIVDVQHSTSLLVHTEMKKRNQLGKTSWLGTETWASNLSPTFHVRHPQQCDMSQQAKGNEGEVPVAHTARSLCYDNACFSILLQILRLPTLQTICWCQLVAVIAVMLQQRMNYLICN